MTLRDGEYYWLNAPAISSENPLKIGLYIQKNKWLINNQIYYAGTGIDVIKLIRKPKVQPND